MSSALTVRVTQDDIENGNPQDQTSCPVARAVSRAVGQSVGVGYQLMVTHADDGTQLVARVSDRVLAFLSDFDDYRDVEPFRFGVTFHEYKWFLKMQRKSRPR